MAYKEGSLPRSSSETLVVLFHIHPAVASNIGSPGASQVRLKGQI